MKTTQQNHPLQAECARAANDWDKLLTPKTTHTPGPWAVAQDQHSVMSTDCEGRSLAMVARVNTAYGAYGNERVLANACLIAAAPDLLSTCQAALDLLQDGDAEPCDADRVTAILVAAIDRATRN